MFRSDVMPKAYHTAQLPTLFHLGAALPEVCRLLLMLVMVRHDLCKPRKHPGSKCHCTSAPHSQGQNPTTCVHDNMPLCCRHLLFPSTKRGRYVSKHGCSPSALCTCPTSISVNGLRFPMQIHGISLDFSLGIRSTPNHNSTQIQKQKVAV
jgi:hypothetical protein